MVKKIYLIENLNCANCASKIEKNIKELPDVQDVKLVFSTKQLIVTAENHDLVFQQIIKIIEKIEPKVTIKEKHSTIRKNIYVKEHLHNQSCKCGVDEEGYFKRIYCVENLCCRICSEKIEEKIRKLPGVKDVSLVFTTLQLRIVSDNDPNTFIDDLQRICSSIKHDVTLSCFDINDEDSKNKTGNFISKLKNHSLLKIFLGTVLFIAGMISNGIWSNNVSLLFITISYIVLGSNTIISALRNFINGQVFDENFLMTVATIGAFCIGEVPEAAGIMLFFRIGEYFEHRAVEKSRESIMSTVDMRPEVVTLVTESEELIIASADVKVDDVVLVKPGERVPLDGIITDGKTKIDTSAITGESIPKSVKEGDSVLSGCINMLSPIKLKVINTLEHSMVSKILDSVENAAANKPKIDRFLTRFARVYTPVVVLTAMIVAVVPPLLFKGTWNYWIYTALSFLVISCPCALVLSVPLAFFSGIGRSSQEGILFKGGSTLEALSKVNAVVVDKTGTITKGDFVVQNVKTVDEELVCENDLLALAASMEKTSTHPIAHSICMEAQKRNLKNLVVSNLQEIAGKGLLGFIEGEQILCGNRKLLLDNGIKVPKFDAVGTEVFLAKGTEFIGYISIFDTIKDDTMKVISDLKRRNIFTAMVTGDSKENAEKVASMVGIDEVYSNLLPEQKLEQLKKIKSKYGSVMFVGDGINDAPIIAGADVGVAMGSGSDSAIEIADVVYMSSKVECITRSIDIAKNVQKIAKQNVTVALAVKMLIMMFGIAGFASMWTAVFADTGVAVLCILNSVKLLKKVS